MNGRKKKSFEDEAAEKLSRSLMPNLHAAPIWNAVALSFLNPAMSLNDSLKTADAINELRKAATKKLRSKR